MNNEGQLGNSTKQENLPSTSGTADIDNILKDMNAASDEILLSMVATTDGLTITTLGAVYDEQKVGAMCSELLAVCAKSAKELQLGDINEMFLRCSDSNMLIIPAGQMVVLALMTKQEINLGLLLIEAERAAKAISLCF